jgi:hypothetical protein
VKRYVGFRPLGFFEDGNQYGIWVAATALAAIWFWRTMPNARLRGRLLATAIVSVAIAFMSQSLGAILLLCAGLALSLTIGRPLTRWAPPISLIIIVFFGAIYLSGKVPLRGFAENTSIGRQMVEIIRSSGRGSLIWRIARDQTALPLILSHPVVGTSQWDWWRKNDERPWGLAILILGQFGLIGFALAFGSLLIPASRALRIKGHSTALETYPGLPLAVIVLMASADALLNSFFFYPAILAAGALTPCHEFVGSDNEAGVFAPAA